MDLAFIFARDLAAHVTVLHVRGDPKDSVPLLGEGMSAATLASMMFDTWTKKLSKLPDDLVIMPAHGAGSLCGAHLSDFPPGPVS